MRVARVFPRRTNATPTDDSAYVGRPDFFATADRVEISVTFSWDIPTAERLAVEWERIAPVTIGGPATGQRGGDFIPGKYLKPGYVITSRGCPNHCWFCSVWRRDGKTRELPITSGWNLLDDNLLACSESHVRAVFRMLHTQQHAAAFTGGLEAARLREWHIDLLASLKPRPSIFFAYDTADDYEPLVLAGRRIFAAGFTPQSHHVRCYVLIGWPGDTIQDAERRLGQTLALGLTPAAMLWAGKEGRNPDRDWRRLQRSWMRPAAIFAAREKKR